MKRNEMIMLAYIAFLIISCFGRVFGILPLWERIVTATTVSGALLAVSDFAFAAAVDRREMNKSIQAFSADFKPKVKEFKKILSSFNSCSQDSEPRMIELLGSDVWKRYCEDQENDYSQACEIMRLIEKKSLSQENEIQKLEKAGNWLVGVGFFAFFCIIVFERLASVMFLFQDYLTVIAFAVILFSQFISFKHKEKVFDFSKCFNEVDRIYDSFLKRYGEVERLIREIMEEPCDAD